MAVSKQDFVDVFAQFFEFQRQVDQKFQTEILDVIQERKRLIEQRKRGGKNGKSKTTRQAQKKKGGTSSKEKAAGPLACIPEEPGCSTEPVASGSGVRSSQRSAAKRATELASQQINQKLITKMRNPGSNNTSSLLPGKASTSNLKHEESDKVKMDLKECVVVLNRCSDEDVRQQVPPLPLNVEVDTNLVVSLEDCFKVPDIPQHSRTTRLTSSAKSSVVPVSSSINIYPVVVVTKCTVDQANGDESSDVAKVGVKRKSEEENNCPNKMPRLTGDVRLEKVVGTVVTESAELGVDRVSERADASAHTTEPRSRTKTLLKSTVSNLPDIVIVNTDESNVEASQSSSLKSESEKAAEPNPPAESVPKSSRSTAVRSSAAVKRPASPPSQASTSPPEPSVEVALETPKPTPRMTRTRTKEMNKKKGNLAKNNLLKAAPACSSNKSAGKENVSSRILEHLVCSASKTKPTPLATNNSLFSPSFKKFQPTPKVESGKKMDGSAPTMTSCQREDAAILKKQQLMKAHTEVAKRKRVEKEQRQLAHKQAVELKERERLARLEREKEEKERQVALARKMKEELAIQKKLATDAQLKEAEERRLREEEAKLARIKKQEEEKARLAEERLKQTEEARQLHEARLAQEAKEKQLSTKLAEKMKQKVGKAETYELTPAKEDLLPKKPKNENDYGLSDAESGDSTDDEKQPKKVIPKWARNCD